MKNLSLIYRKLLQAAIEARTRARAPYSGFRVGAAVMTSKGKIFTGCNVEISSYSLTLCAERTALFKAISEGEQSFRAIAVASDISEIVPPCGSCRQVIFELAGDIDVLLTTPRKHVRAMRMSELLPYPFDDHLLKKK